jgi:heptosyltransferase II
MQQQRILVRATNWVGDAVMSLPALHALRRRFPESHIAILARPAVADLYRREPFCDEVILYKAPKGWKGLRAKWRAARALSRKGFDMALLLQNAFEAAALAWVAQVPERIGYNRDGRGFLLSRAVAVPLKGELPAHQRFYYLELLKRAGLIDGYDPESPVSLGSAAAAAEDGKQLLKKYGVEGNVIGISPGAAFGGAKRWLPERFAQTAVTLGKELNATVAIFGSKEEAELGSEVARMVEQAGIRAMNLAGKTSLREFIDLAAACSLFVTNDSGSMHVASALGVPTAVVFGPTDEYATGPAGDRNAIVREPVVCAPCHRRECPIDHRCMTRVSAQRVASAALQLLQ